MFLSGHWHLVNFECLKCGSNWRTGKKEGGTYCNVRKNIHMKLQNFVIFIFPSNNKN